ncbi:MAG: 3-isopropylmalate dehydratase large subunit [Candidatus Gastranaerophilales bacterium]|nr:3-isopropylmalate dehydratase large subunit [Candidatus Gastranaerophilales bacterium]
MTITEKIFALHTNKDFVQANDLVEAKVDIVLANDITGPIAIEEFEKIGLNSVFDKDRVVLVPDHFVPNKDIKSAIQAKTLRDFAKKQNLTHKFDVGTMGIEHALLPEKGIVTSGDLIIGADSHTCTYGALGAFSTGVGSTDVGCAMAAGNTWFKVPQSIKVIFNGKLNKYVTAKDLILHLIGDIGVDGALYKAIEFSGEVIRNMDMDGRFTICNMAIEAGAKNGIIEPDEITREYLKNRSIREPIFLKSDVDAKYERIIEYDVSKIEPTVSYPHLPENTHPISEAIKDNIKINQVVIGSCTNGRLEDIKMAAEIFKGRKVHPDVRAIVFPATQDIVLKSIELGYYQTLIEANVAISTPTCGPCLGGHCGILAPGEVCVSTTNRNFVGRMGDTTSKIYLASPYIAAASAIKGRIASVEEL